jgi:hypothetical protein|tara:strand:+ start:77 stop:346 length:270 start_codon:yes stop_codon:yes gene_type:complete
MILNKIRIKVIAGIALEEVGKIITIIITSVEMTHLIQIMKSGVLDLEDRDEEIRKISLGLGLAIVVISGILALSVIIIYSLITYLIDTL